MVIFYNIDIFDFIGVILEWLECGDLHAFAPKTVGFFVEEVEEEGEEESDECSDDANVIEEGVSASEDACVGDVEVFVAGFFIELVVVVDVIGVVAGVESGVDGAPQFVEVLGEGDIHPLLEMGVLHIHPARQRTVRLSFDVVQVPQNVLLVYHYPKGGAAVREWGGSAVGILVLVKQFVTVVEVRLGYKSARLGHRVFIQHMVIVRSVFIHLSIRSHSIATCISILLIGLFTHQLVRIVTLLVNVCQIIEIL